MTTHTLIRREIKALVFDQYGTVVDMQAGLTQAVAPFLAVMGRPRRAGFYPAMAG